MKIHVGSVNAIKLLAVKESVLWYHEIFPDPTVVGVDPHVHEFHHPRNLAEVVDGAIARAKTVFRDCDYSFGIEGGLIVVPQARTGYLEVGVCVIFDGEKIAMGFSQAFEWPKKVLELILSGKADGSAALRMAGLTQAEKLGATGGGGIEILTKGRTTRLEKTKDSIMAAMIQLQHPSLY